MKNFLLSTILLVCACSTSKETKVVPSGDTEKPGAPTKLESQVGANSAKLSLHFDSPGEEVWVTATGISGVTVTSSHEVLSGVSVKRGEDKAFEVAFTKGAGRGHLVISVRGKFGGMTMARVHSVVIGEGPLPDDGSKVLITNDGDAVKVMP